MRHCSVRPGGGLKSKSFSGWTTHDSLKLATEAIFRFTIQTCRKIQRLFLKVCWMVGYPFDIWIRKGSSRHFSEIDFSGKSWQRCNAYKHYFNHLKHKKKMNFLTSSASLWHVKHFSQNPQYCIADCIDQTSGQKSQNVAFCQGKQGSGVITCFLQDMSQSNGFCFPRSSFPSASVTGMPLLHSGCDLQRPRKVFSLAIHRGYFTQVASKIGEAYPNIQTTLYKK